jgi:predicted Zn-dependent protease
MFTRKTYAVFIILFSVVLILIACAINPVTGKRELMLVSEQQEIELGQQTDAEIAATYGVYENPALTAYVDRLGQNMARLTHRPNLEYHFKVLDTSVINAFAVPGGYVYVTRGILAYLNDEAELAGVVGHELGHVNARHSAQQMSQMQLAQLGLGLGMALSEKLQKYGSLVEFGVSMLFLKFSRDNERQADDLGVEYGSKSGYDMYRMASFFETLERMNPNSGGGLPDWFSTHPNPVDRIGAINRKTAAFRQSLPAAQYAVKKDDYLKTVNGIVYGDDPRQGYVEANAFYHPSLKITFPIPAGWQVNNTPSQVQIVSEAQDAVIQLSAVNASSSSQAADQFVQQTNAAVSSREQLSVNGLRSEKLVAQLVSEQDTLQAMSYFIAKGGTVFVLHGLTGRTGYSKYAPTFSKTAGGFKNLTDATKINVKPQTLTVKAVTRAGSLRNVLKQFGAPDGELDNLAIMNGMQLTDNVALGTKIKTVVK